MRSTGNNQTFEQDVGGLSSQDKELCDFIEQGLLFIELWEISHVYQKSALVSLNSIYLETICSQQPPQITPGIDRCWRRSRPACFCLVPYRFCTETVGTRYLAVMSLTDLKFSLLLTFIFYATIMLYSDLLAHEHSSITFYIR